VWDDDAYVVKNGDLEDGAGLLRIWTSPRSSPQYYPLVFTSFWIERQWFGREATAHHVTNVLLQVANGLWLWAVLSLLGVPGAYVAALVFALHPVHVESVAWVTERKNLLSGFFYLSALWLYLREYLRGGPSPGRMRPAVYAATVLLVVCALLSKTVTATWPIVVLTILWWKRGRITVRDGLLLLPFLAIGAGFGLLTAWLEVVHVGAEGAEWSLSPIGRLLLASRVPWFYAWKLAWPNPLMFIYPRWSVDPASLWQYLFPALSLMVVGYAWSVRRRASGLLTVLVCFVVTLAPALGILNVYPMRYSWVADHFQYLASAAVIVGVVALAARAVGKRPELARMAVGLTSLIVVALGLVTRAETAKFDDLESLWTDTIAKNPGAWIAHNNLGNLRLKAGRYDEAMAAFESAIRLKPDLAVAHNNLGSTLFYSGRLAEATASHQRAVDLDPRYTEAVNNLGVDLMSAGRFAEAVDRYRQAIRLDPTYAMAHFNMANAFVRLGDEAQAERSYRAAIRLKPDLAMAHFSLGLGRWPSSRTRPPSRRSPTTRKPSRTLVRPC
jgi:tetratricopeptide (TPR) repeat protein